MNINENEMVNNLSEVEKLEDSINKLKEDKKFSEEKLDHLIKTKNRYIKMVFKKSCRKQVVVPVIIFGIFMLGIIYIITSKILLIIIMGIIVNYFKRCRNVIKVLANEAENEYEKEFNRLSEEIKTKKIEIEKLIKQYNLQSGKNTCEDDFVISPIEEQNDILEKGHKTRKLYRHR